MANKMRLIDATALIVDLKRQYDEVFGKARKTVNPDDFFIERQSAYFANVIDAEQNGFIEYLEARPTVDAVPVVYCKDCKWCSHDCGYNHCDFFGHFIEDDELDQYCCKGVKDESDRG